MGGQEILQARFPEQLADIHGVIAQVQARRSKPSRAGGTPSRMLYAPMDMNRQFCDLFRERGYREIRERYIIELPQSDVVIPGAYRQIDLAKDQVLVEVQFGAYAAMFYDMAKFQRFCDRGQGQVGVEIAPCHALANEMPSGVSYGEQLVSDIERLGRRFPTAPVYVILIAPDEDETAETTP
jgi:hypothetical protein